MSQENQRYYRTTPARTAKMMAIMLGICIAGGAIFFAMWDYWISEPAPVVAMMAGEPEPAEQAVATGKTVTIDLDFVESDDFRTMAFNALPGEDGHNPTINVDVGDRIIFNVANAGISFHAFGVTRDETGYAGIIPGSEVGLATNPLKPGESGSSEFVAGKEGTYYYICTVPGHREMGPSGLGMVGQIIVGPSDAPAQPAQAAPPTGVSRDFVLDFVESDDFRTMAFNALPGEDGHNPEIRVNSGDEITVTATNMGVSFHAFGVVASPDDFNNVLWDSEIASMTSPLKNGESGQVTFIAGAPGTYYYICTVPGHALQGMQGSFTVE